MKHILLRLTAVVAIGLAGLCSITAQTDAELAEATLQGIRLYQQGRFVEAIPHLEVVVRGVPDSAEARFMYGWSLIVKSKQTSNTDEAKELSAKALEQFLKAKELGYKGQENDELIALLSGKAAPGTAAAYSQNKDAEQLMVEAETLFAQSKYDEAIKKFEKALALDPKIYQAAISGGDSYVAKSDWENAEKWYQRAIVIDPTRETAYRYSATPFMKQKKYDVARDRYIEAYITEPYSRMSARGIGQWADATETRLAHPALDIPEVSFGADGKVTTKPPIDSKDPAMRPWLSYTAVRELWRREKFSRTFPKAPAYRHSLQEEVEALRAALTEATRAKVTNKQLDLLSKVEREGLLEAFVLLSRPDQEIADEHADYLKNNRPKLRQYVLNYIIQK